MLAMRRTGIKRLVLKREGVELELEREDAPLKTYEQPVAEQALLRSDFEKHRHQGVIPAITTPIKEAKPQETETGTFVTAPMVGTVYHSASPQDPPFVKPGDKVEKNTIVCIIEAMKVMNEIKAGVSGIVSEPLVENGQPVEFGTKLFRLLGTEPT